MKLVSALSIKRTLSKVIEKGLAIVSGPFLLRFADFGVFTDRVPPWRIMMSKRLTTVVLIAAMLAVSACNTVKGLGRDIESVGRAGEEAID